MWRIRINFPGDPPYNVDYHDIKDFYAFQKYWKKGHRTFTFEVIGEIPNEQDLPHQ